VLNMNKIGLFYDIFMRIYAKLFLVLVFSALVLTHFLSRELMATIAFWWIIIHIVFVFVAFFFHIKLYRMIKDDVNKLVVVASSNTVNTEKDPVSFISLSPFEIPENIITVDPNARAVFAALKKFPFIHCVCGTIHSYSYFRYDWLKVNKSSIDDMHSLLLPGDVILYHNDRSIMGLMIRVFTRCYWEHSASYAGDGFVVEAVPGGMRKTAISDWISSKTIDIAVLRIAMDNQERRKVCDSQDSMIGIGYNYLGVFKIFWMIITNKLCSGLMSPLVFVINIVLLGLSLFFWFYFPDLPRAQILILAIFSPYMFDSVYHWIAYRTDINEIFEVSNE